MKQIIDHLLEGLNLEDNLTDEEMSRMIRFLITLEDETFQLYTHLINSTDNQKVNAVFKGIADKKGSHLTLLMRLLGELGTEKNRMLH